MPQPSPPVAGLDSFQLAPLRVTRSSTPMPPAAATISTVAPGVTLTVPVTLAPHPPWLRAMTVPPAPPVRVKLSSRTPAGTVKVLTVLRPFACPLMVWEVPVCAPLAAYAGTAAEAAMMGSAHAAPVRMVRRVGCAL